jgi:hypothetical protein
MFIESGIIIMLGMMMIFCKLSWKTKLYLLGHPIAVDLAASAAAYIMHGGSLTGGLAAAVAGLMTSAMTSGGRYLFGYIEKHKYFPGAFNMIERIK